MTPDERELLEGCAREPIHIPGAIQPHGRLLAIDAVGVVCVASAEGDGALGGSLAGAIGAGAAGDVLRLAPGTPGSIVLDDAAYDVTTHRSGELLVVEIEPSGAVDLDEHLGLLAWLRSMQEATTLEALMQRAVDAVRDLTGFDRVMAYRFDHEWNGEVVAEARDDALEPFLGLRYPASDIPPQARALYLRNRIRSIPAVDHEPRALVHLDGEHLPLDLSDVSLRAVSPVHLRYLANMGVAASLSAALVVHGDTLWGLIACHHYAGPRRLSARVRAGIDVLAGTASALVAGLELGSATLAQLDARRRLDALTRHIADRDADHVPDLPVAALLGAGPTLLELLAADGAAARTAVGVECLGDCPQPEQIEQLVQHLVDAGHAELVTSNLASIDGASRACAEHSPGVVAVRCGADDDWLLWFRREQIRSVRWGGDLHNKIVETDATGRRRLGPRNSFAEYTEIVRGRSREWSAVEVDAARSLAHAATEATARRDRRQREMTELLHRAVLLERLPVVPGADVAMLYHPADRAALGGDWYDLFFLPDGRAVVAIGDVAGHGWTAAATMAQLRHALRAYVVREPELGPAMQRLNELARTLLPGEMATAVVALFDPQERTFEIVSAGHLPPVVVSAVGGRLLELPRHPALGLARHADYAARRFGLEQGATFLAYTDGLIERRTVALDHQIDALVTAAAGLAAGTCQALCDGVYRTFADGRRDDDVTVFALRFDALRPAP